MLSVYQLLRKNGFDDDHIILIIDKTLANDTQNDEPGIFRISTNDKDLLSGSDGLPQAVVDYASDAIFKIPSEGEIYFVSSQGRRSIVMTSFE